MAKARMRTGRKPECCGTGCRVEAVIGVDGRGQMVLPKALRQRLGLEPGGKVAVISWQGSDGSCCLSLVNAGALTGMAQRLLGPLLQELTGRSTNTAKRG